MAKPKTKCVSCSCKLWSTLHRKTTKSTQMKKLGQVNCLSLVQKWFEVETLATDRSISNFQYAYPKSLPTFLNLPFIFSVGRYELLKYVLNSLCLLSVKIRNHFSVHKHSVPGIHNFEFYSGKFVWRSSLLLSPFPFFHSLLLRKRPWIDIDLSLDNLQINELKKRL